MKTILVIIYLILFIILAAFGIRYFFINHDSPQIKYTNKTPTIQKHKKKTYETYTEQTDLLELMKKSTQKHNTAEYESEDKQAELYKQMLKQSKNNKTLTEQEQTRLLRQLKANKKRLEY